MIKITKDILKQQFICVLIFNMLIYCYAASNIEKGTHEETIQNNKKIIGLYGTSSQNLKKREIYTWRKKAEQAVVNGLRWLKENQNVDGSWGETRQLITTCFALEAYLCHGESPESEVFGTAINRAITYLINTDKTTLSTFECAKITQLMSEVYAITKNDEAKLIAESQIYSLIKTQNNIGGWGQTLIATTENNTIIDCWGAYALNSYKLAGLTNNKFDNSWIMAIQGIRTNSNLKTGAFGVLSSDDTSLFATSAGVRALNILGAPKTREYRMGFDYIVQDSNFSWEDYTTFPLEKSLFKYYFLKETMFEFAVCRDIDKKRIWWDWYSKIQKTFALKQIVNEDNKTGYWVLDRKTSKNDSSMMLTVMSILLLESYHILHPHYELMYEPEEKPDNEITVEIDI